MNKLSLFSFLFALLLASCVSLSGVKKTSNNIVGTWSFSNLSTSENISLTEIKNIFTNSTIIFENDKSFKIVISDLQRKGEWSIGNKGKLLILGFDDTKNTDNRLKTFNLTETSDSILTLNYILDEKEISLTFKKVK